MAHVTGTGSPHPSEKAGLRAIADFSDSEHGARVDVEQVLSKGTPVADITAPHVSGSVH
jgi:hypothetical protein